MKSGLKNSVLESGKENGSIRQGDEKKTTDIR